MISVPWPLLLIIQRVPRKKDAHHDTPDSILRARPTRTDRPALIRGMAVGVRHSPASAIVLGLVFCVCDGSPCRANGLVIAAPILIVTPGSSGSFDVVLMNTNASGGASYDVSVDSLELALSGPAGVAFTDVTINTILFPYIYTVSATTLPGSDPLNFGISFPNTDFAVADADGADPFFRTVNPGDIIRPGETSLIPSSSTFAGTDTITIASLNVGTSLSDINGNAIPFTATNGSITSRIPEPSTLIQAATAILIGLGALWRRRKTR